MLIWLSLLFPIVTIAILIYFFNKNVVWWECLVPFGVAIACILISKFVSEKSQVTDTEYWGGYGITAIYYEAWDERVTCSHPEYCSRTVTDSDGNTHTEQYQCGWQHPYDVDYHPEYWELNDSNNDSHRLSREYWEQLCIRWKNKVFVDMHRNYHSIDGDSYVTKWNNQDSTLEPVTSLHSYENRVQASNSIFNFQEVDVIDKDIYGLFEYPSITSPYFCQNVLGNIPNAGIAQRKLEIFNSKFGAMKQIRVFLLSFQNQPIEAALLQENYWKGGNKNEFIICVGSNSDNDLTWCHVISWTEVDELKILIRDNISKMKKVDAEKIIDYSLPVIFDKFKRKEFIDFSYIKVEPTTRAIIISYIIVLLSCIGISFWVVKNDIDESSSLNVDLNRKRKSFYLQRRNKKIFMEKEREWIVMKFKKIGDTLSSMIKKRK